MPVDRDVLKAVAAALGEGQGEYDETELAGAYQEISDGLVKGAAADLVLDGKVALRVENGTVLYTDLDGGDAAQEIKSHSRAHLRLVRSPQPD